MEVTKTRSESGTREKICRNVKLKGLTPIMFDRYPGDNDTKLTPSQKLYLGPDGMTLTLPSINVMSFLSAKNTDSAPKRLLESRKYKKFTEACAAYVSISAPGKEYSEDLIFTRNGKPIKFDRFNDRGVCESSKVFIKRDVARLEKGIPNPKERPTLPMEWQLELTLNLFANDQIQEQQLHNIFIQGGIAVGLGTWRGRYGKFEVVSWK